MTRYDKACLSKKTDHLPSDSCQAFREFVFTAAAIVGALPSVGAGSCWGNHSFTCSVFLLCLCFRTTSLVMQCDWFQFPVFAKLYSPRVHVSIPICSFKLCQQTKCPLTNRNKRTIGHMAAGSLYCCVALRSSKWHCYYQRQGSKCLKGKPKSTLPFPTMSTVKLCH